MSKQLLQQIKDEVAKELGHKNWSNMQHVYGSFQSSVTDMVATRYARAVAQKALEKAAYNVALKYNDGYECKQSITDPNNIEL